jgi:hypothetical protein
MQEESRMSDTVQESQEASGAPVVERSKIAKEIEALSAQEPEQSGVQAINESLVDSGADIDVPISDFWDNKSKAEDDLPKTAVEDTATEEVVSDVPPEMEIIKFKANGREKEVTLEEASKKLGVDSEIMQQLPAEAIKSALSKIEGGTQAFSKLAQTNKKLKELESKLPELEKFKSLFDKLESVKHNEDELLKIISGKDPETWKADFLRKQRILETVSEAEKAQLEKEERVAQLEKQLEAQRVRQEELEKSEQDRLYKSEKDSLKTMLEGEFFKHKFALENEVDSNDVNEMLWQQGQRRMSEYVKKYQDHPKFKELLPKMAQKSFEDVAGKLNRLTTGSVQAKVDEAIKAKKQKAAEKAAVASTRRISEVNPDDFTGLGVREIADRLIGKKKFTY